VPIHHPAKRKIMPAPGKIAPEAGIATVPQTVNITRIESAPAKIIALPLKPGHMRRKRQIKKPGVIFMPKQIQVRVHADENCRTGQFLHPFQNYPRTQTLLLNEQIGPESVFPVQFRQIRQARKSGLETQRQNLVPQIFQQSRKGVINAYDIHV
jgi:hypothetical protein